MKKLSVQSVTCHQHQKPKESQKSQFKWKFSMQRKKIDFPQSITK